MRPRGAGLTLVVVMVVVLGMSLAGIAPLSDRGTTGGAPATPGVHGGPASRSAVRLGIGPSSVESAKSAGKVVDTLVLSNNTLVSGNLVAAAIGSPESLAYDATAKALYVLGSFGNVGVINASSRAVTDIIALPRAAAGNFTFVENVTYAPPVGTLYVSLESYHSYVDYTGDLLAINTSRNEITTTIALPEGNVPYGMAYDTKNKDLYVDAENYSVEPGGTSDLTVLSTTTGRILQQIPGAGGTYGGVAYDPSNQRLYALNESYDELEVVSGTSNVLLGSISIPCGSDQGGGAIGYDSADKSVYAVSFQDNNVCVVSVSNNALVATIPLATGPSATCCDEETASLTVDPKNDIVYVPDYVTGIVSDVSGATNTVVGQTPDGLDPIAALYDGKIGRLFVANQESANLTEWNPTASTVVGSISFGEYAEWASVDPTSGSIFLSAIGPSDFVTLNATSDELGGSVALPGTPVASAYDTLNGRVFALVENPYTQTASLVDVNGSTLAIGPTATLGMLPWGVTFDPANGALYSTNYYSDNISVVSGTTGKTITSIAIPLKPQYGEDPEGIVYDAKDKSVFTDIAFNSVRIFRIDGSNNSIVQNATLPYASVTGAITADPSNGNLYIAGADPSNPFGAGQIAVLGVKNLTAFATIPAGGYPGQGTYDAANGYVYIPDEFSDNVTVFNPSTNKVVATIAVGMFPDDVVYDPVSEDVYVLDVGSGTISIISSQTVVTG